MENEKKIEENFQEFYIAVRYKKNDFNVYASDPFKLSEIDIINLIKICILEARSKAIGKKILAIYEDATKDREDLTKQRLEYIGIKKDEEPKTTTTTRNSRTK